MEILILAALALAGAAIAGVVAHASASKTTIRVTEREYKIGVSATHAAAGPVRFEIKNTGKLAHAVSIRGVGVKTRTKLIQPGKTGVLLVTLKSGAYSIWCPVPGHAALGMKAKVTVPAAAGGGGAATTSGGAGDTTTDSGGAAWG
jgi:uncharacterized cupredoxin-like copper-binding protein